ncbi:carbamoyltransferase N-terminal domain-containing protein, partial [Candidatus Margulisiibacteriota bacterium]
MKNKYILGIAWNIHNRSACLLKNGKIACAIEEDHLDRRKHSLALYLTRDTDKQIHVIPPLQAINYCLEKEGIGLDDLELIVSWGEKGRYDPSNYLPIKNKNKILLEKSHHLLHAYSTYSVSPFKKATIIVVDGEGTYMDPALYESISIYKGSGNNIKPLKQVFTDKNKELSLGKFY